jgi:hypothetical protein
VKLDFNKRNIMIVIIPIPALIYCASVITVLFLYYFSNSPANRKSNQASAQKSAKATSPKVKSVEVGDIYRQIDMESATSWSVSAASSGSTKTPHRRRPPPLHLMRASSSKADESETSTLKAPSINGHLDDTITNEESKKHRIAKRLVTKMSGYATAYLIGPALRYVSLTDSSNRVPRTVSAILDDDFSFKRKKTMIEDNYK